MNQGTLDSLSEADNLTKSGWYSVIGTSSASPLTDWGTLIAYREGIVQEFRPANNRTAMFIRYKLSSGWGTWNRIDNFGYNTLEELASGVAGIFAKGQASTNVNVDELTDFGFYSLGDFASGTLPTKYGVLLNIPTKGYYSHLQLLYSTDTSYISAYRFKRSETWSEWRTIIFS